MILLANTKKTLEDLRKKYGISGNTKSTTTKSEKAEQNNSSASALADLRKKYGIGEEKSKPTVMQDYLASKYAENKKIKPQNNSTKNLIDFETERQNAYTTAKNKANTKTFIPSNLSSGERTARIKEINNELSTLTDKLNGYSRAKAYGTNKYMQEAEQKDRDRIAEISEELKTLERTGTFSASELKQFEIDDAKAKVASTRQKVNSYGQRPSVDVADEWRAAMSEQVKAENDLKELKRSKALYDNITEFGNVVNEDDFFGQWRANYRSKELSEDSAKAFSAYMDNPNDENKEIALAYDAFVKEYMKNNEKALDDEGQVLPLLSDNFASYLAQQKGSAGTAIPLGLAGAAVGLLGGAAGVKAGWTAGYSIGSGINSYDVIRGSLFSELISYGLDEESAKKLANDDAIIEALIESGETAKDWAFMLFGGGTGAAKSVLSKALTKTAKSAAKSAAHPILNLGWNIAKGTGLNAGTEYLEEGMQGAVSRATREKAWAMINKEIGRYGNGNIDLYNRPIYKNADGTISTVDSVTFTVDGKYVLLPTIVRDENGKAKRLNTDEEIFAHYKNTGEHLGEFDTLEEANAYANRLHYAQAYKYSDNISTDADDNALIGGAKVIGDALFGGNTEALSELHEQGIEGFKTGLVAGGIHGTVRFVVSSYATAKTFKEQNEIADTIIEDEETLNALIEEGKASGEGTVSAKLAEEVEQAKATGSVTREQVKKLIASNEVYIKEEEKAQAGEDTLEQAARDVVNERNRTSTPLYERLETQSKNNEPINVEEVKKATGFGEEGSKLVAELANREGTTLSQAERTVKTAYYAGFEKVESANLNFETDTQINAFTAGKKDRVMQDFADKERAKNAVVNKKSGFSKENLPSDVTKTQAEIVDKLFKAVGVKGYVTKGLKGNAEINRRTGEVLIDFDFEREIGPADNRQKVSIVFHAAHEAAMHRARELAPDEMTAFMHEMYKHLAGNEPSTFTLADQKRYAYAEQGVNLSLDGAIEEISANNILYLYYNNESKFLKAIDNIANGTNVKAKQGLTKWIECIKEIIAKISDFLAGKNVKESAEIRAEITRLRDMFETGLAKAVENAKAAQSKGIDTKSSKNLEIKTNEDYNGNINHSLKWRTDLNKTQYNQVEKWIRQAGNPEATRITDTANWYKGRINGDDLFVIYSDKLTILYERKGINGKAELDILLSQLEEIEHGRSIVEVSQDINTLLSGDWLQEKHNLANNNAGLGGRGSNSGYASVLQGKSSKFIGSQAFRNVVKNLFEIQERKSYSLKEKAPTFYSHMGKTIEGIKQDKIGANSVVSYLKGRGVKDEEIKWSGIETFLDGKKSVTKAELQEFVAGNQLVIEENVMSDEEVSNYKIEYTDSEREKLEAINENLTESWEEVDTLWEERFGEEISWDIRFNDDAVRLIRRELRKLSDGNIDSLCEQILSSLEDISLWESQQSSIVMEAKARTKEVIAPKWGEYKLDGGDNYREILFKMPDSTYSNSAMSTHWGNTKGVLAHARIQDFDVNGEKMLFVEEIQSDWHNEGHKYNYESDITQEERNKYDTLKEKITKAKAQYDSIHKEKTDINYEYFKAEKMSFEEYRKKAMPLIEAEEKAQRKLNRLLKERDKIGEKIRSAVPDAPFSNNYHEYVLKRLIRMAAEQGYDSIGWTPANIQSQRWSDDFAEGYRIEYDQDIPKFLNKYGKKWGAKVGKTPLNGVGSYTDYFEVEGSLTEHNTVADAERSIVERYNQMNPDQEVSKVDTMFIAGQFVVYDSVTGNELGRFDRVNAPTRVWSMPITDSMKESVLYEGQPMYSLKDSDYLKAVENGDMVTAQRMVDEAAKDAGYIGTYFHGSKSEFTVFKKEFGGKSNSNARIGFWFTESEEGAKNWLNEIWWGDNKQGKVYKTYLSLNNPKVYESVDTKAQREELYKGYESIDKEMSLYDSIYYFEDGRRYHSERYDYDKSKRRSSGVAEWDAFKAIVKKYDADTTDYYLSKVPEGERETVKQDAERYLELSKERKALEKQLTELSYSDAYELFRTDIYKQVGLGAEDANIGGTGKYVENEEEMLKKYVDMIKQQGYDGIIIKNTSYDSDVFGSNNNQYLVFDSNQVKSADPVTYDNKGNVIPLSQRFNKSNDDIRYSLKDSEGKTLTESQQEYFKNSKIRDKDGNLLVMYHGTTRGGFTVFDGGKDYWYFTNDKKYSYAFEGRKANGQFYPYTKERMEKGEAVPQRYKVYLNVTNPYIADIDTVEDALYWDRSLAGLLREKGYDALMTEDMSQVIVLNANQIKNTTNKNPSAADDIRYSLKGTNNISTKDRKELLDIIEHLKGEFEITKFAKADSKKLAKMTREVLKEYSSKADFDETFKEIDELYKYMANGEEGHPAVWEDVYNRAYNVAQKIVENALVLDDSMYQEYKQLRSYLRNTPMKFNSKYDSVPYSYENFQDFYRSNFGRLKFSKNGTSIDAVYQELSTLYPEFFDSSEQTNSADQLERILDVLDEIQPTEVNLYNSYEIKEATTYLANDLTSRFFDVPQAKPTFADKAERKVTEARIAGAKKVEAVRQQKDEKIKKLIEAQREKTKKQLDKLRKQRDSKVKKEQEKRRAAISKMSESQKAKVLRAKIMRHAGDLSKKLINPTDNQHIPYELQGAVAKLLECINLESNYTYDTESHSYKKNDEGLPSKRTKAFEELRNLYKNIASSVVVDPDLLGENGLLSDVILLADKRIADMTSSELDTVWQTIRAIEASVSTANKMFSQGKFETILEFAESLREDNTGKKEKTEFKGVLGKGKTLAMLNMLTPETYFHYLGSAGDSIFRMMRNAQDKHISIMKEVADFTHKTLKDVDVNSLEKTLHTVKLGGEDVKLSTAQLMELYVLMKREQAVEHILVGGILPDVTEGKGAKLNTKAEPIRSLSVADIMKALSNLTDEQKKIADELQKFVSNVLSGYGNEASMRVYNYEKFLEKNYWTIRTNKQEINSEVGKDTAVTSVANKGMAKGTKPHANTSVRIGSIFDTFASHSSDMATYAAWLGTSEDVNRIRNFVFWEDGARTGTVKGILDTVHGIHGSEYLQNLLTDIAIGVKGTDNMNPLDKFIGTYKAASVGANLRVIIQQPTAILRAMDMIGAHYLAEGAVRPLKGWEKAKKHAPIAQWKDWGHFDINTGRQMKDVLFDNASLLEKTKQVGMWGASMADSLAWGQLWNAVEAETKAKHKELEVGSDVYYETVAKRFTEIVDHTQVVDGILQRSQIMRSPDALTKMATSFMGEPTKQYNMAVAAAYDAKNLKGDARKKAITRLGRTAVTLAVAGIVNACAQSIIDAMRDDDKEKKYWEKWLAAFAGNEDDAWFQKLGNVGDTFNPLNYMPFVKDIVSIFSGYDVKRMDMESISKITNATINMYKAITGTGKYTIAEASAALFAEASRLFGLPVANVKRDVKSLVMSTAIQTDSYLMQYRIEKAMLDINYAGNSKNFMDILFNAYNNDRKAYEYIYNDMLKSGYDADKIQSGMETRMKKAEGVKNAKDLSKRYMTPKDEKKYDSSLSKIKSSDIWKSANATQKKAAEAELYNFLTSDTESVEKTRAEAREFGVDETEYTLWKLAIEMADQPKGEKGSGSYDYKEKAEAINSLNLGDSEIAYFFGQGLNESSKEELNEILSAGIDVQEYVNFKAATSEMKADKNAKGNSIPNSKKRKVVNYLNNANLTQEEWEYFYYEIMNYKN